jgi:hypothetical protein
VIEASINQAARTRTGDRDGYPSKIKYPESLPSLPSGVKGTIYHYPIAGTSRGTAVWTAREHQNDLRVFYVKGTASGTASGTPWEYVGIWTHAGAARGQFLKCTNTVPQAQGQTSSSTEYWQYSAQYQRYYHTENGVTTWAP